MKRILVIAFIAMIFTSCIPAENFDINLPPGIWKSVEPNIVLYIENKYQSSVMPMSYLGIYTIEGEEIKIFVGFEHRSLLLRIHREDSLDRERGGVAMDGIIFTGEFEIHDDEMHYFLIGYGRRRTGEVIIFHRLEDYEPINPEDWFQ